MNQSEIRNQVLTDIESRLITDRSELAGQVISRISAHKHVILMAFESGKFAAYKYDVPEWEHPNEMNLITHSYEIWKYIDFLVGAGIMTEENLKIARSELSAEYDKANEIEERRILKRLQEKYA